MSTDINDKRSEELLPNIRVTRAPWVVGRIKRFDTSSRCLWLQDSLTFLPRLCHVMRDSH